MSRLGVLFLCTGNSARSQMAEGFTRHLAGDRLEVWSAGLEPRGIHPLAHEVMKEVGVDLAGHTSKGLEAVPQEADYVITLCDHAAARCPDLPARIKKLHWSLPDPTASRGGRAETLQVFRRVRDEVRRRVEALLAESAAPPF